MDYLADILREEYEYEVRHFNPSEKADGHGLSELDVLKAHFILSDYFLKEGESVRYGLLNFNMLSSAVSRQYVEFEGQKKWSDDYHRIATLMYGLTMDHAFHDGNKRTALLCAVWGLNRVNREVKEETINLLEELVVRIASRNLSADTKFRTYLKSDDPEINYIAEKLRNWTRRTNKILYTVTYEELNSRLKDYDCYLDNPDGNRIGLFKIKKKNILFVPTQKPERLRVVGFPGWKKQVGLGTLHAILKAAELDPEHGIDSEVFFHGATPSYELLKQYRAPLIRLKDS